MLCAARRRGWRGGSGGLSAGRVASLIIRATSSSKTFERRESATRDCRFAFDFFFAHSSFCPFSLPESALPFGALGLSTASRSLFFSRHRPPS